MFGSQKSFSGDQYERLGWITSKSSFSEEWEKRTAIADKKVEKSVKEFGKNLWPLTDPLIKKFEEYKEDPKYSWLTESDIWLQALQKLYGNNQDKMPGKLEWYLKKMMGLLVDYKKAHNTVDGIAALLKSSTSLDELSKTSSSLSWEKLPPFNSRIRPAEGIEPLSDIS